MAKYMNSTHFKFGLFIVSLLTSSVVLAAATQSGSVNFIANITSKSTSLLWYTTNMKACTASGGWSGKVALSGGQVVSNPKVTTTYTLTCSNSVGNISKSVVINGSVVSGQCGSANGATVSSAPVSNLCSAGTPTAVTGSGPWFWNCLGSQGGSNASCSAQSTPSLEQRIAAAQLTASNTDPNSSCGTISQNATGANDGFYWEIGDQNGIIKDSASGLLASGSVQPASAVNPNYTRTTLMSIASSSKWLYGTYVVEKKAVKDASGKWTMPSTFVPFMHFTSGYDNLGDKCPSSSAPTVTACLNLPNGGNPPVPNGTLSSADVGYFKYNGGHLEALEGAGAPQLVGLMNGGSNNNVAITNEIKSAFSARSVNMNLTYDSVLLAGGAVLTPGDYAAFLQGMIRTSNPFIMSYFLNPTKNDPYAVCTNTTDPKCVDSNGKPLSKGSPIPTSQSWHYGVTHWIEDDPIVGDGAYSSAGAFGFYPWIDSTKTYYGIVARLDSSVQPGSGAAGTAYFRSVTCGVNIRKAFMTGVKQN